MNSFAERWRGVLALGLLAAPVAAEDLGETWGTAKREREYYRIVQLAIPEGLVVEAGAFHVLPDGSVAVGTRRGDIYIMDGVDAEKPEPSFHLFATGLDEIDIEDRSVAILDGERPVLRRTLTLTIPKRRHPNSREVWFRALTGEIEAVDGDTPDVFKTEEVRVSATGHYTSIVRTFGGEEPQEEVLLLLQLPSGTSTFKVDYELLR